MIAITPKGEHWYTPRSEQGSTSPTRFKLRDLTHGARVRIFDAIKVFVDENSGSISTSSGMRTHLACKASIIEFDNLLDGDGKAVEIKMVNDQIADESLERIPWNVLREIGDEVIGRDVMTKDERKKPEPSPED